jgi:predicted ferric reductase
MRHIKGEVYFPIIIAVHLLLWALDLAMYSGPIEPLRVIGEVLASWVLTVLALNLLMTTRAKWIERIFGGLDKMYTIHRRAAFIAVALLIVHFVIVPKSVEFHAGKPLGIVAIVLILIGVILSAAPPLKRKIPYHRWLPMHRLMGLFFAVGVTHAFLAPTLLSELVFIRAYLSVVATVAVGAWLYRAFFCRLINRPLPCVVDQVQDKGTGTLEVLLKSCGKPLDYRPGQFAFVTFPTSGSKEAHPFTISNGPSSTDLRFTIKALGDYTSTLANRLEVGQSATVDGPFGHFTSHDIQGKRQLWIAGGIGITPFLALSDELNPDTEVDLYWSVKDASEAVYEQELRIRQEKNPTFRFHPWISDEQGFLTAKELGDKDHLSDCDVLICGPAGLRDALIDQLKEMGVSKRRVHFEEFSFR